MLIVQQQVVGGKWEIESRIAQVTATERSSTLEVGSYRYIGMWYEIENIKK